LNPENRLRAFFEEGRQFSSKTFTIKHTTDQGIGLSNFSTFLYQADVYDSPENLFDNLAKGL
jgi:hypothetical protein